MTGGGADLQSYLANDKPDGVGGLILINSFLTRSQRTDLQQCAKKNAIVPTRSLKYPTGYLADGVHNCAADKSSVGMC